MTKGKLTPKQQRFVEEYLVNLNATQAAVRAGYSEKTAYSVGHENLKKPEVAAAIQEAMEVRSQRTEISQDWILEQLKLVYEASITELSRGNRHPRRAEAAFQERREGARRTVSAPPRPRGRVRATTACRQRIRAPKPRTDSTALARQEADPRASAPPRRVAQPNKDQQILLHGLKLTLPPQPPPRITAQAAQSS